MNGGHDEGDEGGYAPTGCLPHQPDVPQTQSTVSAKAMQMALDMDLMEAACKDDVASIERLVAHGANPNTR
eukprot:COSAG06_NODE_45655_length_353_cov_0.610236_1_plen_70_part_10